MGRHSAPDDDVADDAVPEVAAAVDTLPPRGRHSRGDVREAPADAPGDKRGGFPPPRTAPVDVTPPRALQRTAPRPHPASAPPAPAAPAPAVEPPDETPEATPADQDRDGETPPGGLDLIEDALRPVEGSGRGSRPAPAEPPTELTTESTTEITPIADPLLDEPVPQAVTDRLPPVREDIAPDIAPDTDTDTHPDTAEPSTHPDTGTDEPARPRPSGRSDAALVRAHHGVQLGCALAVLVPVGVYLVVMGVLDRFELRQLLIWIWIPLIVAGVLVGVVLDIGHRRHGSAAGASPTPAHPGE